MSGSPVLGALVGVERAPIPPWLPPAQRLLLRASLGLPHALAWLRHGRAFARLPVADRETLLASLAASRWSTVRHAAAFWKLAACLGTRA